MLKDSPAKSFMLGHMTKPDQLVLCDCNQERFLMSHKDGNHASHISLAMAVCVGYFVASMIDSVLLLWQA